MDGPVVIYPSNYPGGPRRSGLLPLGLIFVVVALFVLLQIDDIERENQDLKATLSATQGELAASKEENQEVKEENKALKEENQTLRQALSDQQTHSAAIETENTQQRDQIARLTEQISQLEAKVLAQQGQVEDRDRSIADLKAELGRKVEENQDLARRLAQYQSASLAANPQPATAASGGSSLIPVPASAQPVTAADLGTGLDPWLLGDAVLWLVLLSLAAAVVLTTGATLWLSRTRQHLVLLSGHELRVLQHRRNLKLKEAQS